MRARVSGETTMLMEEQSVRNPKPKEEGKQAHSVVAPDRPEEATLGLLEEDRDVLATPPPQHTLNTPVPCEPTVRGKCVVGTCK